MRCWRLQRSHDIGDGVTGPWGWDSVFEFRSPRPVRIPIRKDANHPYTSPCMVTAPATASPYHPVLHVEWLPSGGRERWPRSVLLGSLLDSDASKSSCRLVCEISVKCGWASACENEAWTCYSEGKDQLWRQIKADLRCGLSMRCCSHLLTHLHGMPHAQPQGLAPSSPPRLGTAWWHVSAFFMLTPYCHGC